jgi:hypothetical protein
MQFFAFTFYLTIIMLFRQTSTAAFLMMKVRSPLNPRQRQLTYVDVGFKTFLLSLSVGMASSSRVNAVTSSSAMGTSASPSTAASVVKSSIDERVYKAITSSGTGRPGLRFIAYLLNLLQLYYKKMLYIANLRIKEKIVTIVGFSCELFRVRGVTLFA